MPTESIGGNRYFVTFVDDYLRCCAGYFLKRGAEVQDRFKLFERYVVNDIAVKTLPHYGATIEENTCLQNWRATWNQKGSIMSWLYPTQLNRMVLQSGWTELSWSQLDQWWFTQVYRTNFGLKRWNVQLTSGITLQCLLSRTRHLLTSGMERTRRFTLESVWVHGVPHAPDTQRQKLDKKAMISNSSATLLSPLKTACLMKRHHRSM